MKTGQVGASQKGGGHPGMVRLGGEPVAFRAAEPRSKGPAPSAEDPGRLCKGGRGLCGGLAGDCGPDAGQRGSSYWTCPSALFGP